uniref:Uncharacterized protein n=1 Tax=Glossina palpalis gambiensis TaxID=67801 RepID=A0A1B0C2A3_9MUSC
MSIEILRAKKLRKIGIILGTFGRHGNARCYKYLEKPPLLRGFKVTNILEIYPQEMALFKDIDAFAAISTD